MNNGKQNSRFVKETGLTREKRKTLYIFFIAVFVIAAIGLTLTLTLRSCSKSDSAPKTVATEHPTTSLLPTIAITGDPEFGWGWLVDKGFDILQTDWPLQLRLFLNNR